ncbi:MAG: hypothetical protein KF744_16370 [Taibaiella sp.]|nr:hypothetical protein [Taibaiella sp.]
MCQYNCNDYSKRTANTGIGIVNTPNSSLTGSGTVATLFTAGQNGAIIRSVTIKAIAAVTTGMVRLFLQSPNPQVTTLYKEVQIPVTPVLANTPTPTPVLPMYETVLVGDLELQAGYSLLASTQTSDTFNIIVEGLDWEYPNPLPTDCCNFKQTSAITGVAQISTANTNLNGSGSITAIFTAPAPAGSNGALVKNITIKALGSTSINGAIRIFISPDGLLWTLMREVMIPQTTQSAFEPSYKQVVAMNFHLEPDYVLGASTQNGEPFAISVEGEEWSYPV